MRILDPRPRIRFTGPAWLLVAALTLTQGAARDAVARAPEPLSAFPQKLLSIRTTAGRVINFKIWIADTPAREEQGLMFVRHMDEHAGMLFLFSGEDPIYMWMKNTVMPLDMVFIDARGRVIGIAARREPYSLDLIDAPAQTRAVLELQGGAGARFGIGVGDAVLSEALNHRAP